MLDGTDAGIIKYFPYRHRWATDTRKNIFPPKIGHLHIKSHNITRLTKIM